MSLTNANADNFYDLISEGFTVVDFYSTTCVPCRMFARTVEDLALEFPFINFVKINISDYPSIGVKENIEAVPTILFVKDGKELDREVGLMEEAEVLEKIKQYYYGESV